MATDLATRLVKLTLMELPFRSRADHNTNPLTCRRRRPEKERTPVVPSTVLSLLLVLPQQQLVRTQPVVASIHPANPTAGLSRRSRVYRDDMRARVP